MLGSVVVQVVVLGVQQDELVLVWLLKLNFEFVCLLCYEGMFGDWLIVVYFGLKMDEEGVYGEYQFVDMGEVVLFVGDCDGDMLEIEELNDGINIIGVWIGCFDVMGDLKVDWMNLDELDLQLVVLCLVLGKCVVLQVCDGCVYEIEMVGGVVNLCIDD